MRNGRIKKRDNVGNRSRLSFPTVFGFEQVGGAQPLGRAQRRTTDRLDGPRVWLGTGNRPTLGPSPKIRGAAAALGRGANLVVDLPLPPLEQRRRVLGIHQPNDGATRHDSRHAQTPATCPANTRRRRSTRCLNPRTSRANSETNVPGGVRTTEFIVQLLPRLRTHQHLLLSCDIIKEIGKASASG